RKCNEKKRVFGEDARLTRIARPARADLPADGGGRMNEFKNSPIEKTIQEVAEDVQPNMMFTAELEAKLRQAHKPRKTFSFSLRGFAPVLTSLVALGALTFFMVWIFNTVDLQPTPGNDFACPVT